MKKFSGYTAIGVFIVALALLLPQCGGGSGPGGEKITPAKETSFDAVTSKLNPGGNFYLYASTEQLFKSIDEFAQTLRQTLEKASAKDPKVGEEVLKAFDLIYGIAKECGGMEISGVGFSSIPVEGDVNHSKLVVHHYPDKNKGLIWQLMQSKPHELTTLDMLPANTVAAGFGELHLDVLWKWVKEKVNKADIPKVKQGLEMAGPMMEKMGIDLDKTLGSLTGMGYVVTLDNGNMKKIPIGPKTLELPDPGLAIILEMKDDSLFEFFKGKIPGGTFVEENGVKKIAIKTPPMPVTLDPVLVYRDGMLIVSSSNALVDAMFAAREKGGGLIDSEEFKRMSINMPDKGNSYRYLSPKMVNTIMAIQKQGMEMDANKEQWQEEIFKLFTSIAPKEVAMYGVMQHAGDGSVYTFNHTMGVHYVMMMPAMMVTGVVAAIAVPNLLTALQKGKQKATIHDMKSIMMALEDNIADMDDIPPGETLSEMQEKLSPFYIKKLPLKDAWGFDFHFKRGAKKGAYFIGSGGKDGVFNGWNQTGYYIIKTMKGFDNDIILTNGNFVYGPKVK